MQLSNFFALMNFYNFDLQQISTASKIFRKSLYLLPEP